MRYIQVIFIILYNVQMKLNTELWHSHMMPLPNGKKPISKWLCTVELHFQYYASHGELKNSREEYRVRLQDKAARAF